VRIHCHIPITLRIVGAPTDDQLAAAGQALARAVAARLAEAERVLAERHRRHPTGAAAVKEAFDPDRQHASGYAVPSFGDHGKPVDIPAGPSAFEEAVGTAGELGELGLEALLGVPLSSEEMWRLLLLRRAAPLSLPASEVNTADTAIEAVDGRVSEIDGEAGRVGRELGEARAAHAAAKGRARNEAAARIRRLRAQADALAVERTRLVATKTRLERGRTLGRPGAGAPVGTGQITYAVIQVVDQQGRRIALEAAETTATEHAEERVLTRLRARFSPGELAGATMTVVGDQKVCAERCRPALTAFAKEHGIELVESRYFVRPRIGRAGEASPRTTLRTATVGSSAGLPLSEKSEEIYRGPAATPRGRPSAPAAESLAPRGATDPVPGRPRPPAGEAEPGRPRPVAAAEPPHVPTGVRVRANAVHLGANILLDLLFEFLATILQEWLNDADLRDRLAALAPDIEREKRRALDALRRDPWAAGGRGFYYNIYLRITSTRKTFIAAGHTVGTPGSPQPELLRVTTSTENRNALLAHRETARVLDAAGGGALENVDVHDVVYSQPVEHE
jgi:hypothetical protein